MVFRRDNKGGDAFQRQISALRQQLGGGDPRGDEFAGEEREIDDSQPYAQDAYSDPGYEREPAAYGRGSYGTEYAFAGDAPAVEAEGYEPRLPAIPAADAQMTVVSHDTAWKGEVSSEGSMHIHGRFEGVIRAQEDVFILDEATVEAEVNARNVVIAGRYDGEVSCGVRFEVLPTGRVQGNVRAPVLVVHDGAEINGSIQMSDLEADRPAPTSLVHRREAMGSN